MGCASKELAGLLRDCDSSMGGIMQIWLTTTDPKPVLMENYIMGWDGQGVKWKSYKLKKNTCSMASTLNADATNGTNFVTTELALQFNRMDTVKRAEIAALAVDEMYAIVRDSNNKFWYLGFDDPVIATTGTSQTGMTKTDGNFYQITLTDESVEFPYEIYYDTLPIDILEEIGW